MILDEGVVIFFAVFFTVYLGIKIFSGKMRSSGRFLRCPPSLPSLPLIGSLPFLRNFGNIAVFFMEKATQLGPIFTLRMGKKLILILNNKSLIQEALMNSPLSSKADIYAEKCVNPNRKGITFVDYTPQWKRYHRAALTIFKEFGFGVKNIMEERILNEIEEMFKFVQSKQGQPFEPKQLSMLVSSNIIMNIIFGSRREYDSGISRLTTEMDRWANCMDLAFDIVPFVRYIPSYKKKLATLIDCHNKIHSYIDEEIAKSLENKANCFVTRYIEEEGPEYDRQQLNFMVRDLVGGGTETTSSTFLWLLVALANNQQIQRRLQDEIDSVISRDRLPTLQDQSKLSYHEATMLEIFRWRPLVSLSIPRFAKDDGIFNGYFIPAGTMVLMNFYAMNNNQMEWKDPDVFRPERFLDNDNDVIGRDRIMPFSVGRRSCFGEMLARAEVFLLIASVVQRFNILPPEGQGKINDKPKQPVTITTSPEPFSIRLVNR